MTTLLVILSVLVCFSEAKINTVVELVAEYGLTAEVREVTTRDGYIISIFRIPSEGKTPVLIMPGFLSSANTWVVGPRDQNIVAALADKGYDIWLLNYRGSFYGKKHVQLDPIRDAEKFWDFTFHEIGTIDMPSIIDYISSETGFEKMLYLGHSMGSLIFYVMCVERPDYCQKINAAGLLAPVIFPPNAVDRALLSTGMTVVKNWASTARRLGVHEFFGDEANRAKSVARMCKMPFIGKALCTLSVTLPFSRSADNVDERTLPKYIINTLSGTSVKLAQHMTQLMTSNGRRVPKFDYGWRANRSKYGKRYLPYYNGTVSAPLVIFHSTSDPFTDKQSIGDLKRVSNVVYDKLIRDPTFNHINFLFGNAVRENIIDDLLTLFEKVATL